MVRGGDAERGSQGLKAAGNPSGVCFFREGKKKLWEYRALKKGEPSYDKKGISRGIDKKDETCNFSWLRGLKKKCRTKKGEGGRRLSIVIKSAGSRPQGKERRCGGSPAARRVGRSARGGASRSSRKVR